jgi:hypothetical protein
VSLLADSILVVHVLFVTFVVGGLVFIWIGAWRGWHVVHNFRFRALHLAAIVFVTAEALIGIACPLTVWEYALRGHDPGVGFISHWLQRLLYYDFPAWVFTAVYSAFALVVLATFILVPPAKNREHK